jgi:hypothetical protein
MFQFPWFPPSGLCVQPAVTGSSPAGFPHSDIAGSLPAHGSPTLFAVYHVLLRLLTPRHPPFAFFRFALSCGDRACLVLAASPAGVPHGDILREGGGPVLPQGACFHRLPPNYANFRGHSFSSLYFSSPVALAGLPAFNPAGLKADALFCYSLGKEQLLAFSI